MSLASLSGSIWADFWHLFFFGWSVFLCCPDAFVPLILEVGTEVFLFLLLRIAWNLCGSFVVPYECGIVCPSYVKIAIGILMMITLSL